MLILQLLSVQRLFALNLFVYIYIYIYIYISVLAARHDDDVISAIPHEQDMTQGQFSRRV